MKEQKTTTCLNELMKSTGISASKLSRKSGVSAQAIHYYMREKAQPRPEQAYKIISYFNSMLDEELTLTLDNFYNFKRLSDGDISIIALNFGVNEIKARAQKS